MSMGLGNGKMVAGLNLDDRGCRLLLAKRQTGGHALLGSLRLELSLADLDQEEARQAFLAQSRTWLERHGGMGAPAFLALPGQAASLHPWAAPANGGRLKPWGQPPLEGMTPLPAEGIAWAARPLAGQPRLRQVALAPKPLIDGLWDLMVQAGLKPVGIDLAASLAALAAQRLADGQRPCLCLRLEADEASWACLERGGVGLLGVATALPGEDALALALRAAQEAVNAVGPAPETPVWVWGAAAGALLEQEPFSPPADAQALVLAPRPLSPPPLPAGLEPGDLPLWLHLTQAGNAAGLFALHPQALTGGGWLERPALTRRLAWACAGVAAAFLALSGLTQWWDYHQAKSALDSARAQQERLRQERRDLRRNLGPQAALLQAQQLRQQAPRLLSELAARLPAGAWLESLSCQGTTCTLLVAGTSRQDLQQALNHAAPPWRLAAPPAEAGSHPGGGELLKVDLIWESDPGF